MRVRIVCKGCGAGYLIPQGAADWPDCPRCGGGDFILPVGARAAVDEPSPAPEANDDLWQSTYDRWKTRD